MRRWDVIVVGGGPAGAALAITLARAGGRVLVVEKSKGPHHKVCGEFLSADSISFLSHLGLDVHALGAAPTVTLRLVAGKREAARRLPFAAAGLSRHVMDEALLRLAENAGANVLRGGAARAIEATAEGWRVHLGEASHGARLVAVATGKQRIKPVHLPQSRIVGLKMMLELSTPARRDLGEQVMLSAYRGGYQGVQLVEGDQASLCWIVDRADARRIGADWQAQRAFLSGAAPAIADLLSGARPLWPRPLAISGTPFGYLRAARGPAGLLPLGDQMATIPSVAGDGIAIALGSGIAAARAVVSGDDGSAYQQAMRRALRGGVLLARAAHMLVTSPAAHAPGMALTRGFPALLSGLAQATRFPARRLGLDGLSTLANAWVVASALS